MNKKLKCNNCLFLKYDQKTCYSCLATYITNQRCLLNENVDIVSHFIKGIYPKNCPLLDGRVITIKVEKEHLIIGRDC